MSPRKTLVDLLLLIILGAFMLIVTAKGEWLEPSLDDVPSEECFTDSCVGCVDDCLAPADER